MKRIDILAAVLLVVGGLNRGLVAVAGYDLVAALFGLEFGETNAAQPCRLRPRRAGGRIRWSSRAQSGVAGAAVDKSQPPVERTSKMTKVFAVILSASLIAIAAFVATGTRAATPARSRRPRRTSSDRSRGRPLRDAGAAREAGRPGRLSQREDEARPVRTDRRRLQEGAEGDVTSCSGTARYFAGCSSTTSSRAT